MESRGIVTFNFSPRNLTQVTSTMKPGQDSMFGFFFGKENNSSRRVILKIELDSNNLNSILSRSAVTPVFPTVMGVEHAKANGIRQRHKSTSYTLILYNI